MMNLKHSNRIGIAAVLLAVMLLASCGGSDGSSDTKEAKNNQQNPPNGKQERRNGPKKSNKRPYNKAITKKIEASRVHGCLLTQQNKVYCWGDNDNGELATGDNVKQLKPAAIQPGSIPASATITDIATGAGHSCFIADKKAYCSGSNSSGQLGNSSVTSTQVPIAMLKGEMPDDTVKAISGGGSHSCVIGSDDHLYCVGDNSYGQLGNNSLKNSQTLVAVSKGAMPDQTVKAVSTGAWHTCVIGSDDHTYCFGWNISGQLGDDSRSDSALPVAVAKGAMTNQAVRSISAGMGSHTCVVSFDNRAYCFGENRNGQLGNGKNISSNIPVQVLKGGMPDQVVKSISTGENHSCVTGSKNRPYCFGYGGNGNLGSGRSDYNEPHSVSIRDFNDELLPEKKVLSVAAGGTFSCLNIENDHLYCFGSNAYGQLGTGNGNIKQSEHPAKVDMPSPGI